MGDQMSAAVEVRNVTKKFTKYVDTPMLLTSALRFRPATRREKVWAVRDVDVDVYSGESFGVIGQNGSGKTTLMSMIAGITAPTKGSVRVRGRIAPLIAVGVGFHRELTGRENIYVNGAILGLHRREVAALFDEIVAFSGIEEFIDTPVKFYSSGMYVRLGFSVAVHASPDVLVVDEVLAVGDLAFQVRCYEKMQELRRWGTTLILVSHHLGLVRRVCDRVLLLHRGEPRHMGTAESAISAYHRILGEDTEAHEDTNSSTRFEPGVMAIESAEILGADRAPSRHAASGSDLVLAVRVRAFEQVDDFVVSASVFAEDGTTVYSDSTNGCPLGVINRGDSASVEMIFPASLATGSYSIQARIDRPDLRTSLAHFPPLGFFVTGRHTVSGLADLGATFRRMPLPVDLSVEESAVLGVR